MAVKIIFSDMRDRNQAARKRLIDEVRSLETLREKLLPEQRDRVHALLHWTVKKGKTDELPNVNDDFRDTDFKASVADPLFESLKAALRGMDLGAVEEHTAGVLPGPGTFTNAEKRFVAVYGLLAEDNVAAPELAYDDNGDLVYPVTDAFKDRVISALREYSEAKELFAVAFDIIPEITKRDVSGADVAEVSAEGVARVVRRLSARGVSYKDPAIRQFIEDALVDVGVTESSTPSFIEIDLPDLDETAELDIVPDNLRAVQALYFSAILEEGRLFQVADTVVDQFNAGTLPFGRLGDGGNRIFRYWRTANDRLSEFERRNLYARVFGFPGGDAALEGVNRPFTDLWLRFVSSVSEYVRQLTVEKMLRDSSPLVITQEGVRKSARDLASNLSLYGYGVAYFAATELQTQISDIIAILSSEEVKNAYGARDMWQVIETVSALYLNGPVTTSRYRTRAEAGAIIIRWLAENADRLAAGAFDAILPREEVRLMRRSGKPLKDPTTRDLVNACEQWLAVTGTAEARIEEFAQPTEGPAISSVPIRLPRVAEDVLGSFGFQAAETGGGNGGSTGQAGGGHRRW